MDIDDPLVIEALNEITYATHYAPFDKDEEKRKYFNQQYCHYIAWLKQNGLRAVHNGDRWIALQEGFMLEI
jgi:hypothetical protein